MKTTAILCIGDELLDGRIRDENANFLLQRASFSPFEISEVRIVADDRDQISNALRGLCGVDVVIVSGGLGPTADDVTRQAAADFLGVDLEEDSALLAQLRERFESRRATFTENNRRQCTFPRGATVLPTEVGTAAGFEISRGETRFLFFPGVPQEFRWFLSRYLPDPEEESRRPRKRMIFFGLGESQLETFLGEVAEEADRVDVSLGYRAESSLIEVILKGDNQALTQIEEQVHLQVGRWLVAEDEEGFMARVGRRLLEKKATLSVAESCTAGLLGAALTDIAGSSRYFQEGYLTYSNDSKIRLLGVDAQLIEEHGAVSPEVAAQMASGAGRQSGSTFALAITGIAGPSGGTAEKPVGTVDFALATPQGVFVSRRHFPSRSRQQIRQLSVNYAAAMLLWHLEERLDEHNVAGPYLSEQVEAGVNRS